MIFILLLTISNPYITFYSYEGNPNFKGLPNPAESHTFARFTDGKETIEISWGPADGNIWGGPKKGINITVEETIKEAKKKHLKVYNHGTYEITKETFENAKKAKAELESGRIKYYVLSKRPYSKNCIHAIADITGIPIRTYNLRGSEATEEVIKHFKGTRCISSNTPQKE